MEDTHIRGLRANDLNADALFEFENRWHWHGSKERINKLLAHYEHYKSIVDIPGHIFEFGVFKAVSLIRFATFRDALENDFSRKIVGFDAFGKFPKEAINSKDDINFIEQFEGHAGQGLSYEEATQIFVNKGFENLELIKGNVFDTLPSYLADNPQTRIALLHLDMDVEHPTDFTLNLLFERVVPGGLIVFDDYNAVAGATICADNFVKKHRLKLEKLRFHNVGSFIRKPI
jgi:hypothetical protein